MRVVKPDIHSEAWLDLITKSHQTSLFVLPEWLDHFAEHLVAYALEERGMYRAAVVAQLSPESLPFFPYAGLLLRRREDPLATKHLLETLETRHPGCAVINPPSLVDVRPFRWRAEQSGAIWVDDIRYTMFTDRNTKPFPDMPEPARLALPDLPGLHALLELDSVTPLCAEDTGHSLGVVVGKDSQGRGYVLAMAEGAEGSVWEWARESLSVDLFGCNSRLMNARKRVFGAKLRTYYKMVHAGGGHGLAD